MKIMEGCYKGYRFQFAYSSATELKLLILSFQNTIDLVFCEVYLAHNGQAVRRKHQQTTISEDCI